MLVNVAAPYRTVSSEALFSSEVIGRHNLDHAALPGHCDPEYF